MAEVKLLGFWYSPFTHRVVCALKIKGVKYEYIEEDRANKSFLLLQSNPIHKKVPVLIHNGKAIVESMVILEYIDETFEGPSILPKDPYDRALARFWAKFIDDKINISVSVKPTIVEVIKRDKIDLREEVASKYQQSMHVTEKKYGTVTAVPKIFRRKGEEQEKAKEEVCEMYKVLDNELKDKKFFVGDKFGFADIAASLVAFWLGVFEETSGIVLVTSEKFPNFCKWRGEYINCSKIKKSLPARDELLAFYRAFPQAASASASAPK